MGHSSLVFDRNTRVGLEAHLAERQKPAGDLAFDVELA